MFIILGSGCRENIIVNNLRTNDNNVKIILHHTLGCQMVFMNYQNLDRNMKYYLNFFNEAGSAFVPKHPYLCMKLTKLTCPTPPDKSLSFKANNYSLPMISFKM